MPATNSYNISPQWTDEAIFAYNGKLPTSDSIDDTLEAWKQLKVLIENSVVEGSTFTNPIPLTWATTSLVTWFPLLDSSGNVLFLGTDNLVKYSIPDESSTNINYAHIVSDGYIGGVLNTDGTVHFVPHSANVGQVMSQSGVISTYSLVYTTSLAYRSGVLAPNGDIHFVPYSAAVGQKINSSGVVSTYSLVYTTTQAYSGGILSPKGEIHFIPFSASVGQKINLDGTVSTYSLVFTDTQAYQGGVLDINGNIHFVPYFAGANKYPFIGVGQKISLSGDVSTYTVPTETLPCIGGVLSPSGDVIFLPSLGQKLMKIDRFGALSTFSNNRTSITAAAGGVLHPNGTIYCGATTNDLYFTKIVTGATKTWGLGVCLSPFFNKSI